MADNREELPFVVTFNEETVDTLPVPKVLTCENRINNWPGICCARCKASFTEPQLFVEHTLKSHSNKACPFLCYCGNEFATWEDYEKHMFRKPSSGMLCTPCGFVARTLDSMRQHFFGVHPDVDVEKILQPLRRIVEAAELKRRDGPGDSCTSVTSSVLPTPAYMKPSSKDPVPSKDPNPIKYVRHRGNRISCSICNKNLHRNYYYHHYRCFHSKYTHSRCSHCGQTRSDLLAHSRICAYNPSNRYFASAVSLAKRRKATLEGNRRGFHPSPLISELPQIGLTALASTNRAPFGDRAILGVTGVDEKTLQEFVPEILVKCEPETELSITACTDASSTVIKMEQMKEEKPLDLERY